MTERQPLTLERLAALDEAASPGPWACAHWEDESLICVTDPPLSGEQDPDVDFETADLIASVQAGPRQQASTRFIAATKGAAPRLLAALRALAERLRRRSEAASLNGESGRAEAYDTAIADLRHLLETLDLGAAPGGATPETKQ